MVALAARGALIAGAYGILHDQVTYSLGPEYFTAFKFAQFGWADLGLPVRWFVAEIGFLASWWVGLFAGWFLARCLVAQVEPEEVTHRVVRGFWFIAVGAVLGTASGWCFGLVTTIDMDHSGIADFAASIGVQNFVGFTRVAYIHNGTYLGGLAGLVAAGVSVCRNLPPRV